jgi:hypothetical protein
MPQALVNVEVEGCDQREQYYHGGNDYLEATVKLNISVNGDSQGNFASVVKLTVGDSFDDGSIEVTRPEGYTGPYDHVVFSRNIEGHYRWVLRQVFGIAPKRKGPSDMTMTKNSYGFKGKFDFQAEGSTAGW